MFKPLSIEALASEALRVLPFELINALPATSFRGSSFVNLGDLGGLRDLVRDNMRHIMGLASLILAVGACNVLLRNWAPRLRRFRPEKVNSQQRILFEVILSICVLCASYCVEKSLKMDSVIRPFIVHLMQLNPSRLGDNFVLYSSLLVYRISRGSWVYGNTLARTVLARMIVLGDLPSEIFLGTEYPAVNPWCHNEYRDALLLPLIALFWQTSQLQHATVSSCGLGVCTTIAVCDIVTIFIGSDWAVLDAFDEATGQELIPRQLLFRLAAIRGLYVQRFWAYVSHRFAVFEEARTARLLQWERIEPFRYSDIATDLETRVLTLKRRVFFKPPRCELVRMSFEEACQYDICSFAQDDEEEYTRLIIVNGKSLYVSEATFQVLRRKESFFEEPTIWIRCICVDEPDDEERTAQVRNIGGIFRNARRIDAFVNASSKWSPPLTSFLRILQDKAQMREADLLLASWDTQWQSLAHFINQPWFQRTWAFKEVATAGQLSLVNGDESIPWSLLASAMSTLHAEKRLWARLLSELELQLQSEEDPLSADQVASQTTTMNTVRVGYLLYGQISLLNLLKAGGGSRSADPRDRIYALIGLAPASTRQQIEIDYSRDTVEVFTQVMAHIMEEEGDSQILAHSGLRSTSLGVQLPSWVSAWTDAEADVLADHSTGRWTAARRHTFYKDMSFSSGGVLVGLKRVGRIIELGQAWPSISFDEADLIQRERQFLRASWWLASKYYDPTWQTMDDIVCHDLNCVLLMVANSQLDDIVWTNGDGGWEEEHEDEDEDDRLEEEVRRNMMGKRLAVVAPDRLAAVPEVTESGDEVHLLAGARTPFVVRRVDGSGPNIYELVGPCYVIGVMGGELDTSHSNRERDGVRWQMSYIV